MQQYTTRVWLSSTKWYWNWKYFVYLSVLEFDVILTFPQNKSWKGAVLCSQWKKCSYVSSCTSVFKKKILIFFRKFHLSLKTDGKTQIPKSETRKEIENCRVTSSLPLKFFLNKLYMTEFFKIMKKKIRSPICFD